MAVVSARKLEEPSTREPASWALRSFASASAFDRVMEEPHAFDVYVGRVVALAIQEGVTAIAGVSDVGDRVAMAVSRRSGIPVAATSETGPLLLIDGFVSTGIQLALAIGGANDEGHARAIAVGLVVQEQAVMQWRAAGIDLIALETVVV